MFTGACKKITGNGLAAGCQLLYHKIYGYFYSVDTGNWLPVILREILRVSFLQCGQKWVKAGALLNLFFISLF